MPATFYLTAVVTARFGRPRPWPPRPSRTGGAGPPDRGGRARPAGRRRAGGRRPEADPAEGALARVRQRDVAHRGPVLALVVAGLDLAPAAVPHTASLRFLPCA